MRNYRFERAATTRKTIAIFLALLFHLGLLGYVIYNQETGNYLNQLFAGSEKVEAPAERP